QVIGGEQAPAQPALIGGHHHGKASAIEAGNGLDTAGQWLPLLPGFDELLGVLVDHSIPVEDNQFHLAGTNREISATLRNRPRSSANNFRRLPLTLGSSAITMTPSKKASTGPFRAASSCIPWV